MKLSNTIKIEHSLKNIKKNEYLKSTSLHYPPSWVTLGINSACTSHCSFCSYHSVDARHISKVFNVRYTMEVAFAKKIIDFLKAGYLKKIHVCATGDPLLHPDFFTIIDYVIEIFGTVSFQTNFPIHETINKNAINNIIKRSKYIDHINIDILDNNDYKNGDIDFIFHCLQELCINTSIHINANFLMTKLNLNDIYSVINKIAQKKLNILLLANALVFPHGFNAFTDPQNNVLDLDIKYFNDIKNYADSMGVKITILNKRVPCSVFWNKFQIWPTKGSRKTNEDTPRLDNMIPHGCNAVVLGEMSSVGYLFDYPNLAAAWNNPTLISIRNSILKGIAPDLACKNCPASLGLSFSDTSVRRIEYP